jgi:succinate dehydrogenase/fumarate reductase cytochrome b subunit
MLGYLLWIIQLLTGLFIFIGLYIHLFINPIIDSFLFNILFIVFLVFHGINGLAGILVESLKGGIARKIMLLFKDLLMSRNTGHLLFFLHRVTGIFLSLYLIQHVLTNSLGPLGDSPIIELLNSEVSKSLAIISAGLHGLNGLRLIFIDLTGLTHLQRRLGYIVLLSSICLLIYTGVWRH